MGKTDEIKHQKMKNLIDEFHLKPQLKNSSSQTTESQKFDELKNEIDRSFSFNPSLAERPIFENKNNDEGIKPQIEIKMPNFDDTPEKSSTNDQDILRQS